MLVFDGKQVVGHTNDGPKAGPKQIPPNLNAVVTAGVARCGFMVAWGIDLFDGRADLANFDSDKKFPIRDFKMGGKEKVGAVEAQIIEYAVNYDGQDGKAQCKLWLDTKTLLPLKRHSTSLEGRQGYITEVYTEFVIDSKVDGKLFELPK